MSATDRFALGGNWHANKSSVKDLAVTSEVMDKYGEILAGKEYIDGEETECEYAYYGSALRAALEDLQMIGYIRNSILVTKVVIKAEKQKPVTMTVTGHQHDQNAHVDSVVDGEYLGYLIPHELLIPAEQGGWDVWDILPQTAEDASIVSMTITLEVTHNDREGSDGLHLDGTTSAGKVTLSCEYNNPPTLDFTGWLHTSGDAEDANQDGDTYKVDCWRPLARVVVGELATPTPTPEP